MTDELTRAYSKGYHAGRKRMRLEAEAAAVRNERFTALAAAIMSAGMRGHWGKTVNGVHQKYDLEQMETMAVNSARRMVLKMEVFHQ